MAGICATKPFDYEKAHKNPLWYKELYGFSDHVPETEEYGIRSFVFQARRPFDPVKFKAFIDHSWPGVVRAKGYFWLATRPGWVGELGQAGALVRTEAAGHWWVAIPPEHWPDDKDWQDMLVSRWDRVYGDRRQEMVFIGAPDMDEAAIRAALEACLVPDTGQTLFDAQEFAHLPDPFPVWQTEPVAQ